MAWGLDPSGAILDAWGVGDTPEGLDRFAEITLEAAARTVGIVKLPAAFLERHGWQGTDLQRLVSEAQTDPRARRAPTQDTLKRNSTTSPSCMT